MSWKRTRAKAPLIKLMPVLNEDTVFLYKEIEGKIHIKHTYLDTLIDKRDFDTHLAPIFTDGKIEEVTPELSAYLDDKLKKVKKKG